MFSASLFSFASIFWQRIPSNICPSAIVSVQRCTCTMAISGNRLHDISDIFIAARPSSLLGIIIFSVLSFSRGRPASYSSFDNTRSIYQRIDQLTISTSSSVLINNLSSSTSFLSFAHVFRQRQRSYIHQDIQFGVIHRTNSSYLIIYCDEQTSMPYPWHHPLLHQYLCPLIQYHDLMWICYD